MKREILEHLYKKNKQVKLDVVADLGEIWTNHNIRHNRVIRNIKNNVSGQLLAEHCWVNDSKIKHSNYKKGDKIYFVGSIIKYIKANGDEDYSLHIDKIENKIIKKEII